MVEVTESRWNTDISTYTKYKTYHFVWGGRKYEVPATILFGDKNTGYNAAKQAILRLREEVKQEIDRVINGE